MRFVRASHYTVITAFPLLGSPILLGMWHMVLMAAAANRPQRSFVLAGLAYGN